LTPRPARAQAARSKRASRLRNEAEIAAYIEAMLEDGDARAVPIALHTIAESVGGMTALAQKTKLSRETLCRALTRKGNPRLDTLATILAVFGLGLSVQPTDKQLRVRRGEGRPTHA
jgi:probable addiction module antidote protein